MTTLTLIIVLLIGVAALLYGAFIFLMGEDKSPPPRQTLKRISTEKQGMTDKLQLWNEQQIASDLIRLQENQPLFRSYVESVRRQFVDTQNTKIAQTRNKFIFERIESLKLANQYRDLENELGLKNQKYENELLELRLKNQQTKLSFQDEEQELQLKALENERRRLETELHIAKIKREFDEIANPVPQPLKLTPAEIKEKKRADLKARIKNAYRAIEEVRADPSLSDNDKQTQINQLERKKFDLNEDLADLI